MQFEEICQDNYARIHNYILAKTGNREAAEDITQDVFFIAWQKGETFLSHEKPIAFLYATAANLVLEYYKKTGKAAARETKFEDAKAVSSGRDAFEELCQLKSENVNEISFREQALSGLKPKERDLYRKYYVEKKPMKVIAEELAMSETAVRMKYTRIRRKMRRIVENLHLDDF